MFSIWMINFVVEIIEIRGKLPYNTQYLKTIKKMVMSQFHWENWNVFKDYIHIHKDYKFIILSVG